MEDGHPVLRVKRSTIDRDWIGRTATEGWRVLREKPVGSPSFVNPRQIDEAQLASLDQMFPLLPDRSDIFEWQAIRDDSSSLAKGPPAYMQSPNFEWLSVESLQVCVGLLS